MFINCKMAVLMLVLTLDGQVHSGGIIGGHEAKAHSRPYMAVLERHMPDNSTEFCDGFLLNEDFVMTAAHCQAKSFNVLLGVHNFHNKKGVQNLSVTEAFPHKDYNATDKSNVQNDIMLLKLSSKAELNDHVKGIDLADKENDHLPNSCIVSGWGKTGNSHYNSLILMEVNVTLTKNKLCDGRKLYCSEGNAGPAKGDSGGPLVCDQKAYGLVSHNRVENHTKVYMYTKIPDYKDWINITQHNGKFSYM
ncbi:granzyme B-like [Stegastes partitus]|uniref:trypsin n=1 Tax=Stegastes partitus TaxID=144197 RepID=A0A3B5B2P4_9TELE|nr:PREDICTED: granzyme B-like [Stegastes partitus]